MVRKKHTDAKEQLVVPVEHDSLSVQARLQDWYARIRENLPEEASLVASVQKDSGGRGVLVAFRAVIDASAFEAQARSPDAIEAVEEAGASLLRRLDADSAGLQRPIGERLKGLFSEAG